MDYCDTFPGCFYSNKYHAWYFAPELYVPYGNLRVPAYANVWGSEKAEALNAEIGGVGVRYNVFSDRLREEISNESNRYVCRAGLGGDGTESGLLPKSHQSNSTRRNASSYLLLQPLRRSR